MVKQLKNFNLIYYCIGWNFDGPIYAVHTISTQKLPKPKPNKKGFLPVMSWKSANRVFKHKHND